MTVDQWLSRVSGWEITLPKGIDVSPYHGHRLTLAQETKVIIHLDADDARALMYKAIRNASRASRDGALKVKVSAGGTTTKEPREKGEKPAAYGEAPRCTSTLVPGDPDVRCVLPVGHEGSHQDHLLPKRRWTGD